MPPPPRAAQGKTQLLLDAAAKRFKTAYAQGRYAEALSQCQQALRLAPGVAVLQGDAATCCIRLQRWDEAIAHAERALALGLDTLVPLDALAHAWGCKGDAAQTRRWGLLALQRRQAQFGRAPAVAHTPAPLPPPPGPDSRDRQLIAFSLFGAQAKYCECAVLNAQAQAQHYPDWTCCFFVDASVPAEVLARLRAHGARVIEMDPDEARRLPGPMWRFLALDLPGVQRVICRDADSLINAREAAAVHAWVASGRRFHVMRDAATHTELMLAGLWGAVAGALPPVRSLLQGFLAKPLASAHFADQFFLREWVWPYAQGDLLQHDDVFGLAPCEPFPPVPLPEGERVGDCEGSARFERPAPGADGSALVWSLWQAAAAGEVPTLVCRYPGVNRQGRVSDSLPRSHARALDAGRMTLQVELATPQGG